MSYEELIIDQKIIDPEMEQEEQRQAKLIFDLNHTFSGSKEYADLMNELFKDRIGKGSKVLAPVYGRYMHKIEIGKNVLINGGFTAMSFGGITIEDDVVIAPNVQLLTDNHDPYDRTILICKPIVIKKGAWIGAGASILPGVTIGRYAIVGTSAVVTKDVPDYAVVAGVPAKVLKILDGERFEPEVQ